MFKVLYVSVVLLLLCSCGTLSNLPSRCDSIAPGDSLACGAASKLGVRIEDIGNAFVIANAVAIGRGYYTKAEAIAVCEELQSILKDPITYAAFAISVKDILDQYPGLQAVVSSYMAAFNIDTEMYAVDREALVAWLDDRVADMRK